MTTASEAVSVPAEVIIDAAAHLDAVQRVASRIAGWTPVSEFQVLDGAAERLLLATYGEPEDHEAVWGEVSDRADQIAADWIALVADRPIPVGRLLGLDEARAA